MALTFVIQFNMHVCMKYVPSCKSNIILSELFVLDSPIRLIVLTSLHKRWRWVLGQVVHLVDVLIVL